MPIMYAEETDSLPRQYFIDRYENVFMWKKSGATAKCEALFCEEDIQRQWKVGRVAFYYSRRHVLKEYSYALYNLSFSIQFRYYAFQKLRALKGKPGYNFSGSYASFLTGYYLIRSRYDLNNEHQVRKVENIGIEPAIGFQQRLFKKLFVDGSVFYSKNIVSNSRPTGKGYFASRPGLGFTF